MTWSVPDDADTYSDIADYRRHPSPLDSPSGSDLEQRWLKWRGQAFNGGMVTTYPVSARDLDHGRFAVPETAVMVSLPTGDFDDLPLTASSAGNERAHYLLRML